MCRLRDNILTLIAPEIAAAEPRGTAGVGGAGAGRGGGGEGIQKLLFFLALVVNRRPAASHRQRCE